MNNTSISWTEKTWNPISGCTPISEGCANCYAKRMAQRLRGRCGYPEDEPFRVTLHEDKLVEPLRMRKPARVFVCSMGDLFHEDVPDEFILRVAQVMYDAHWHQFLVLTKRPERMQQFWQRVWEGDAGELFLGFGHLTSGRSIPQNVWCGVTAENQARADERIPLLLQVPASVRFVSVEPMLGPVDLSPWLPPFADCDHYNGGCARPENPWAEPRDPSTRPGILSCNPSVCVFGRRGLDWVICGGETGPGARPMHPDWVRSLRDQCGIARVPFHFKSWGEWGPHRGWTIAHRRDAGQLVQMTTGKGNVVYQAEPADAADDAREVEMMRRVSAKYSGRLLDGKAWDEWPEVNTNG